ncbi:hypothetical protein [Paenibacillus silviterrae]|uniref:hypothetical protein n=1 Tax=Paenibacillus silviterrae TaxID=3242194 RepID=UPI002542DA6E|nr:hypothetical protein [Paenibacillus chinjuensis]
MNKLKYLSRVDLFRVLGREELEDVSEEVPITPITKGTLLTSPHHSQGFVFLIKSGSVRLYTLTRIPRRNDSEQNIMMQHIAYWTDKQSQGITVDGFRELVTVVVAAFLATASVTTWDTAAEALVPKPEQIQRFSWLACSSRSFPDCKCSLSPLFPFCHMFSGLSISLGVETMKKRKCGRWMIV